jgi:polyhydroxybutyrate depolymerase
MNFHLRIAALVALFLPLCIHAQEGRELPPGFHRLSLMVEGTQRTGFYYAPEQAKTVLTPVVFVFHGHGGTAFAAGRSFAMHRHWPEAISVCLQGLNTPGRLTDPEGKKSGWQGRVGDQGDRDLKFFDATLAHLKAGYQVDAKRIFSTGHSNGGGFTYLLWAARPQVFAAMAPSAAAAARKQEVPLTPKPAMHIAGTQDPLVKYAWQQMAMETVKKVNGCVTEGKPWATDCTIYPSPTGTPFIAFIHQGTHKFPDEAPPLIARFFKEQAAAIKEDKPATPAP